MTATTALPTDGTGTLAVGISSVGVLLNRDTTDNTIGGAGNVISGNGLVGVACAN